MYVFIGELTKITNMVRVITSNGSYSCPTKTINGELFFKFKRKWHKVEDYLYKK